MLVQPVFSSVPLSFEENTSPFTLTRSASPARTSSRREASSRADHTVRPAKEKSFAQAVAREIHQARKAQERPRAKMAARDAENAAPQDIRELYGYQVPPAMVQTLPEDPIWMNVADPQAFSLLAFPRGMDQNAAKMQPLMALWQAWRDGTLPELGPLMEQSAVGEGKASEGVMQMMNRLFALAGKGQGEHPVFTLEDLAALQSGGQAKSAGAASGAPTQPQAADLLYFATPDSAPGAARFWTLQFHGTGESGSPEQALQGILQGIEGALPETRPLVQEVSARGQNFASFFPAGMAQVMPNLHATTAASEGQDLALQTVRQAQAVMIDMVERMRGDVKLDTQNLRAMIHLQPPSLGRIQVDLTMENGSRLHANVQSEQGDAHDFLQEHQSHMQEDLERQGFRREDIELVFEEMLAPTPADNLIA